MATELDTPPQPHKSRLFGLLFIAVIILVVLGAFTLFQRRSQYQALAKETETLAVPTVAVIHPTTEPSEEGLVLPGSMQAYVESPIYARTNGYLKKWYRDIGSRVRKGELLADIDTPEVDQQLLQARADLETFKHIYAPFSGVITRRNVDIGTLINAGNGGATQQLFSLAQTDPIRVYVNVPESAAPSIHAGLPAHLDLTQFPGRKFLGKVVRTAEAIDPVSRTLLTEVDVPNKTGELLPGGYAQLHLQALTIGRDYGVSLEVLQGLSGADWIVLNPADSLEEGQHVNVKEPAAKATGAAPTASAAPNGSNSKSMPGASSGKGK